jgi:hypothetical protein
MVIRVELPFHLRRLAGLETSEARIEVPQPVTLRGALEALEARFPALTGTIRDPVSGRRRPFVRFYACEMDFSHAPLETPLPEAVAAGREPLWIIGAIAGG